MNLSGLKWPVIIGVVVLIGWLMTSSGVNYMFNKFTASTPGADAAADDRSESGLSWLGKYSMTLFKYEKAAFIFETAVTRYPEGKNRWYNQYHMARCMEKLGQYDRAVALLRECAAVDAHAKDNRVARSQAITSRVEKLIEVHQLEAR